MTQQVTAGPSRRRLDRPPARRPVRPPRRPSARPPATLPLPAVPAAAAASRRHVQRLLTRWHLAACLDTAQLLVSELVANAVTATRAMAQTGFPAVWAPIELSVRRSGTSLIIEVRDPNPDPPAGRRPGPLDEDGRGLFIVGVLSSRWGHYAADRGGKVVWCEIAVPSGPIALARLSGHGGCHDRDPHHRSQQRARLRNRPAADRGRPPGLDRGP
jgi:anti-sigma regulatory factor (Ser/Thr protein kinase)